MTRRLCLLLRISEQRQRPIDAANQEKIGNEVRTQQLVIAPCFVGNGDLITH